jgi:hypothetical protein
MPADSSDSAGVLQTASTQENELVQDRTWKQRTGHQNYMEYYKFDKSFRVLFIITRRGS